MQEDRREPNMAQNFPKDTDRENAMEELTKDQQFRKFFTTSVVEIPDEILADEEEKEHRGFGGWLKKVFRRSEDNEVDEEEEIGAETENTEEDGGQEWEAPEIDDAEEDESEPAPEGADFSMSLDASAQEPTPKIEPVPQQSKPTNKEEESSQKLKKAAAVDASSLLESISMVQADMMGRKESAEAKQEEKPQEQDQGPQEQEEKLQETSEPATAPGDAPALPEDEVSASPETKILPVQKAEAETEKTQDLAPDAAAVPEEKNAEEMAPARQHSETDAKPVQPAETAEADDGTKRWPPEEVPLTEPTGEISLGSAAVPEDAQDVLPDAAENTEEEWDGESEEEQQNASAHPRWEHLKQLFAGIDEEDEEDDADEDDAEDDANAAGDVQEHVSATEEDTTASEMSAESSAESSGVAGLEYTSVEDADTIRAALESSIASRTLRAALTGILALALIVLDLMGQSVLPSPAIIDPATAPAAWLGVHLILLAVCIALTLPVLKNGFLSLLPRQTPSADALAALAASAALLQAVTGLIQSDSFDPTTVTVFSGAAVLLLSLNQLGHLLDEKAILGGFSTMTSGVDNATGYCLKDKRLIDTLCEGMDEKDPVLLLSRPGSLMKNFMAQSFAPHRSDRLATEAARTLGVVALVGFGVTLGKGAGFTEAVTVMAAVLCMGAPLSATLVRAVPARLMQRAAAQVGATVPGWPAIEQLGDVDMVQVDAAELFPPMCAHLFGIKTFRKERVDLAILYATSILVAHCDTLAGLFSNMIENDTSMLYPVKDLVKRAGLGYVAWCDNCRVVLGSRELMAQEGIALPALDYENRYSLNGEHHVLYLAVSGELYAMFLFGYTGTKKVARTLGVLKRENIRLLVTADDPTLTAARIEEAYRLRTGFIKVLGEEETQAMAPAVAYMPATDGCLVHLGGFASFVGGLEAAAGADSAEHIACTIQLWSVIVSVVLGLLLSFAGSMAGISLGAVLLYQLAWSALSVAVTLTKKY